MFGEIVLRNALVTPEQLDEALGLQKQAREIGITLKLGEVLLQKGWIDTRTLEALLKIQQRRIAGVSDPHTFRRKGLTPKEDQALGHIAVDNGLISAEKLAQVLELQRKAKELGFERRLGEILVEEGAVPADTLEALLQVQKKKVHETGVVTMQLKRISAQEDLAPSDLLWGQVAVHHGFVTEEVLEQAVEVQRVSNGMGVHMSLGEILVDQGHLKPENLAYIADIQNIKKAAYHGVSLSQVIFKKVGDKSIGQILQERGLIEQEQIDEVVAMQAQLAKMGIKRPIGELLLDKGYLSAEILFGVLEEQITRRTQMEEVQRRREWSKRTTKSAVELSLLLVILACGLWGLIYSWWRRSQPEVVLAPAPVRTVSQPGEVSATPVTPVAAALRTGGGAPVGSEVEDAAAAAERARQESRNRLEALAQELLGDRDPSEFAVALTLKETPEGPVFDLVGQGPLPDGAEVATAVLYFDAPIPEASKTVHVRGNLFHARTGPLPGGRRVAPGLYTARAEFRADRSPEAAREARAAGAPVAARAAVTMLLGTVGAEQDFAERVRAERREALDFLAQTAEALRAAAEDPKMVGPERWTAIAREWTKGIDGIEDRERRRSAAVLAVPDPEFLRRLDGVFPLARDAVRAVATHTLAALGAEVPVELAFPRTDAREALIPHEYVMKLLDGLRAASAAFPAGTPEDAAAAAALRDFSRRVDLARVLRGEVRQAAADQAAPHPALSWLEPYLAEVRDLRRVDLGLHEIAKGKLPPGLEDLDRALACLEELGKLRAHALAQETGKPLPVEWRPLGTMPAGQLESTVDEIFVRLGGSRR